MNYFRLLDDVHIDDRWHLGVIVERGSKLPLEDLRTGRPVYDHQTALIEITHPGIALEFCFTSFAVPVATTTLAGAIAQVTRRDLQRVPAIINAYKGFEVLNAVRIINCLDEKRSEFTKWAKKDHRADLAGDYRMVTKLKIDSTRLPPDAHFFRIERWPMLSSYLTR